MVLARYARRALEALTDPIGEEFVALSRPHGHAHGELQGYMAHLRKESP